MQLDPIIPPDPIEPNQPNTYRYDGCYQSMMLVMAQRQIDAISGISGDSFKNSLLQVDTVGNTHYLGYATAGSVTNGSVWSIKKVVEVGNNVTITCAEGTKDFDNIWDDRLTLTYS